MDKEDMRRFKAKLPYVTKKELLTMAQETKAWLLESEAEQRVARLTPRPRDTEDYKHLPALPRPKLKPTEERLTRYIRDRLGPRVERAV